MELFSPLLSSPFGLLLTTVVTIGVLKFIAVMRHACFYWKGKGIPYRQDSLRSLVMDWKKFLFHTSYIDYHDFEYNCFPDAKYHGTMIVGTPFIHLRDPELIKNVFVKDFEYFNDHDNVVYENVDPLLCNNVFFLNGRRWKEMRNMLSYSFTTNKMKIMFDWTMKCADNFVTYLVDHPELCVAVETREIFRHYTTDVGALTTFGINVNSIENQNNEFYMKGVEISDSFNIPITYLRLLKDNLNSTYPRVAKLLGMATRIVSVPISEFFTRIIEETIRTRERQGIVRPDMIHLLMQARDKDGHNEITFDDIASQALISFVANFSTSTLLMCFVVHELALNQDIQDRLREELLQHLDERNELSYESLSKMTYMNMVISETLRKYPPLISTERLCTKSYKLPPAQPGYKSIIVERGSVIMIPIYAIHRDPEYYPNPNKFDPERFNKENKGNINPYTYLPFGHGPRKCIAYQFVLLKTKILVACLLQKFIVKRTEKTVDPLIFSKSEFNLEPVSGFWISLEKREAQ